GLVTEAVDAQHLQRLAMEQDLQHAHRFATDLRPGGVLEERLTHFVGNPLRSQLTLGLAQRTDLRNGVDTGGHVIDETPAVVLDDIARSRTPLVEGRTGQARPADHITRCVDVGHLGAIMLIHRQLASTVGLQTNILQTDAVGITGTTVAPEKGVGLDLLPRLQVQHHTAVLKPLDLLVLLVVTDQRHVGAQMVTERIGDLVIEEAQQPVAVVDEVDLHPQTTEDGGVFTTDHSRTVDDQRPRRVIELENGVAVVDARVIEIDIRRPVGSRAGADDDFPGYQAIHGTVGVDQFDSIGVGKTALAVEQIDTVARVVTVAGP